MQFVYPSFLFALAAIAVPILIHLFQFRRFRKVLFPNLAFLQKLTDESRQRSRLKHLLVLLARILAISALVFAFSQPHILLDDRVYHEGHRTIGVYIDNSFSMDALSDGGRLLDEARDRALRIAVSAGSADRFVLLTNDFEGRQHRLLGAGDFRTMVEEVSLSPVIRTLDEVVKRMESVLDETGVINSQAWLISDFQKNISILPNQQPDSGRLFFLLPLPARLADNVYIDSCWFATPALLPDQPASLTVRIVNDGAQELHGQSLRLFVDGVQRAVTTFDIETGSSVEASLNLSLQETGMRSAWVEISDYPVTFDDRLYFHFPVASSIPVLVVESGERDAYLETLLQADALFDHHRAAVHALDFTTFPLHNLIILNGLDRIPSGLEQALATYVEQGGHLLVLPGSRADLGDYGTLTSQLGTASYARLDTQAMRVAELDHRHPLFYGVFDRIPEQVDLPAVSRHYRIVSTAAGSGDAPLVLQNGSPFIYADRHGDGRIYLSAVPLDEDFGEFHRHILFVPVILNMAIQSAFHQPAYMVIGHGEPLVVPAGSVTPGQMLTVERNDLGFIPEQRILAGRTQLFFHDQVGEAGIYKLKAGEQVVQPLAFNYDRRESQMAAFGADSLEQMIADAGLEGFYVVDGRAETFDETLQALHTGRPLWRLFLLMGLLFLLAEVGMLRWWK